MTGLSGNHQTPPEKPVEPPTLLSFSTISARLPLRLHSSDAHMEPPPLRTMTKSKVSSHLVMARSSRLGRTEHVLVQRAMKIGNRPFLQWIRPRALEASRLHAALNFTHV